MTTVLGVDIGTTGMKIGVFRESNGALEPAGQFFAELRDQYLQQRPIQRCGAAEMAGRLCGWLRTARRCHRRGRRHRHFGTTPGMTTMAADGTPLYPAILMLDQRSRVQAVEIIGRIGLERILAETSNMPVAGGCSLASILWLRDNEPEVSRTPLVSATPIPSSPNGSPASSPSIRRRPRSQRCTTRSATTSHGTGRSRASSGFGWTSFRR